MKSIMLKRLISSLESLLPTSGHMDRWLSHWRFFTGVKLSTGHAGVAFTPIGEIPEAVCCPTTAARMPRQGIWGKPVSEILKYAWTLMSWRAPSGVATLNALTQWIVESEDGIEYQTTEDAMARSFSNPTPWDGLFNRRFRPYIRRLKMMGNPFFIIEKNPQTLRTDEIKYFKSESEMASTLEDRTWWSSQYSHC